MSVLKATWSVSIFCDCPFCAESVDLTDADEFWPDHPLSVGEHGTGRSRDLEVTCPACKRDLVVDLEW